MIEALICVVFYLIPAYFCVWGVREIDGYVHIMEIAISLIPVVNILYSTIVIWSLFSSGHIKTTYWHKK